MSVNFGVNGVGRIGRLVIRAAFEKNSNINLVAINHKPIPIENIIYQLKYDSAHLQFPGTIEKIDEDNISINGKTVRVLKNQDPSNIRWGDHGVDVVCESTGQFLTQETAGVHINKGGAKKVILSSPAKDKSPTYVYGVNHKKYDPSETVISNASCTTNCLGPMSKVLHERFGIQEALMTTIHSTTPSQKAVDGSSKKDLRAGRAASTNIIPASTGAAKGIGLVIPELVGKMTGMAFRVPTINVSVVDLTVRLQKNVEYSEIMQAFREEAAGELNGILGYTEEPVVSQDFIHNSHSSVIDAKAGIQLNDQFHKIVSWYDNEWGYSNRILDLAEYIHKASN